MSELIQNFVGAFLHEIKTIIGQARTQAVRSMEFYRVEMYWRLGERIFEEEQQGKERADYGSCLISGLAEQLAPEFGSGFSVRQLERCRQFYRMYPIASAVQTRMSKIRLIESIINISVIRKFRLTELENEIQKQLGGLKYE